MRMNISVPDGLAEQVRKLDLPISAVCQKALGAAVEKAERRAAFTGDLGQVVARLRATVDAEEAEEREDGAIDGMEWAKLWATARELAELSRDWLSGLDGASETLVAFVEEKYSERGIPVDVNDEDRRIYWHSFRSAALEVWDAVHEEI
jgi:Post-segregation antitoxin CcdA